MNRKYKHGKVMKPYEEAMMNLMIKMEESEHYFQEYHRHDHSHIRIEDGEDVQYPSFSINRKNTNTKAQEEENKVEEVPSIPKHSTCDYEERYIVKLTAYEWLEARRSGITTLVLAITAFFLQVYITWTNMDEVSLIILKGMKYGCIIALVIKLIHWIKSGGMQEYLNEEG